MPAGRPPLHPLCPHRCPVCSKRLKQRGATTAYRCACGRAFRLVDGELVPLVRRVKRERGERRVRGLTADQFEDLVG